MGEAGGGDGREPVHPHFEVGFPLGATDNGNSKYCTVATIQRGRGGGFEHTAGSRINAVIRS